MEILVNVIGQKLKVTTNLKCFISGSQQFVKFIFNMDSEWDNLLTFAQFRQNGVAYNQYLDEDNSVYLPSEIGAGACTLILYGTGGDVRATTNYLTLTIDENILVTNAQSTEITQSLYEQLVNSVTTTTNRLQDRVANVENVIQGLAGGAPIVVSSVSEMIDTEQIYILSTDGMWYYHNGTAWTAGGEYGAVATDTTLTQSGVPADAKAVGDEIADLKEICTNNPSLVFLNATWELGTLNHIGGDMDSDIRYRTGYITINSLLPFYIHASYLSQVYIYEYDENKIFIKYQGWFGHGVNIAVLHSKTKYIRAVVRQNDDKTNYLSYVTGNTFLMQTNVLGQYNTTVLNPLFYAGTLSDNYNFSNVITYATNRRNSVFIPVDHKFIKISLAEGYQAYCFQYDSEFGFIREDGWIDDIWSHALEPNCKYIRLTVKNDVGSDMSAFDSLEDKVTITLFDTIRKVIPNETLMTTNLICHRGAASAPENTLPAIELAIEQGYKHIEIDLEFTSDNVCVLLHDTSIDRTSDGTGKIYDMTYEDALQYDFGSWKSPEYAGTKIPKLEEALLLCKRHNVCLQLDIASTAKTNINIDNLTEMLNVINRTGMIKNVDICAYANRARNIIGIQQGLIMVLGVTGTTKEKIADFVDLCSFFAYSSQYSSFSQENADYFHTLGAVAQTWEIDNAETAEAAFGNGVDWIITNTLLPSVL